MPNDEPTYVYTKGIGWHPGKEERRYLIQAGDCKVWAIDRLPRKGEHAVTYVTHETDWWDGEGLLEEGPTNYLRGIVVALWQPVREDWKPHANRDHRVMTVIKCEE